MPYTKTIYIQDSFDGLALDEDLNGRSPEVGVVTWSAPTAIKGDGNGRIKFSTSGSKASIDTGIVNQSVECIINSGGADNRFSINCRANSAVNTNYDINIRVATNEIILYRLINGTTSILSSITHSMDVNADNLIRVDVVGSTTRIIDVWLNNAHLMHYEDSVVNSVLESATYAGFTHELRSSSGGRVDDFEVNDVWNKFNLLKTEIESDAATNSYGEPIARRYIGSFDKTYYTSTNSAGIISISEINHSNNHIVTRKNIRNPSNVGPDEHLSQSGFTILGDGRILIVTSSQSEKAISFTSTNPEDISAWDAGVDVSTNTDWYSNPYYLSAENKVVLLWREDDQAFPGNTYYSDSTDGGATWSAPVKIIETSNSNVGTGVYFETSSNDTDRIDVVGFSLETDATRSVRHYYYNGGVIYGTNGTQLDTIDNIRSTGIPISWDNCTLIYDTAGKSIETVATRGIKTDGGSPWGLLDIKHSDLDFRLNYVEWNGSSWSAPEFIRDSGDLIRADAYVAYNARSSIDRSKSKPTVFVGVHEKNAVKNHSYVYRCIRVSPGVWNTDEIVYFRSANDASNGLSKIPRIPLGNPHAEYYLLINDFSAWTNTSFWTGTLNAIEVPDNSVTLSGISGVGHAGDINSVGAALLTLAGVSASGQAGTLTVQTTSGATITLSGVSGTGNAGLLSATGAALLTATGAQGTGQTGTLSATGGAILNLGGAQGTGQPGSVTSLGGALSGLPGVSSEGQPGTVTIQVAGGASITLSGTQSTGQAGTLATITGASFALSGVASTGQAGTLTVTTAEGATVTLAGVQAAGDAGDLSVLTGATVSLSGAVGTGQAGTVTVTIPGAITIDLTFKTALVLSAEDTSLTLQ